MSRYGIDENGKAVRFNFSAAMHTVLAGVTRSGKSVTAYSLLAEAALDPRVKVCGVDPSGILLAPHCASEDLVTCHLGTENPGEAIDVVERLVRIMDSRIKVLLERGFDKVPHEWFSPRDPILLVVLEEYAGTLEWLKSVDQSLKPAERLLPRMTSAVGRLLREGAKAGIRVLTIVQRPEAAVLHDRAQYARRISHRIDNADSMRMLFEGAKPELLDRLKSAAPGLGLLDEAGEPLRFFRAYDLDYQSYRRVVVAAD